MKYVYIFLGLFAVGFVLGSIHAIKDNSQPKDTSDIIDEICPNLNLEMGDSTSWIGYKCKNQKQAFISFETLTVRTDPNFEFKDKKVDLPFVSFDRIYATVGGGLLLSWSIKDIFKSSSESKDKFKILAGILGAITGYSAGYYLFRSHNVDCSSKEVEGIFTSKENLSKLKKRIIIQNLISETIIARNKDSLKCFYLGKMSRYKILRLANISSLLKDSILRKTFINVEKKYEMSYDKLWDNRLDSFSTSDLKNILKHISLIKQIFSNPSMLLKQYTEYQIKPTSELSKEEIKALINGS